MLGLVVTPNGTMYRKDFADFEEIHDTVGGYIEHVLPKYLENPFCILINEGGKLKRLPVNPVASAWYGLGDVIVGNAVVMKDGYVDGERDILGLSDDECLHVIGLASYISFGEYRLVEMEGAKK